MENNNVIYIDYFNSYLDVLNDGFPRWIRNLLYRLMNFFGRIKVDGNRLKLYCVEEDKINSKMINNLKKKLLDLNKKDIVLSTLLLENADFINWLKKLGYNILDGRWLYKFLCYDIVEKIACIKNKYLGDIEVTVLSNEDSEINLENIKLLAEKCKLVNVVTNNPREFRVVEKFFYDEYGSIINVSTNKEKTCRYSDIILNFDFSTDELKKCKIKDGAVIVQFSKEKFENKRGTTIVFYKLNFSSKYLKVFEDFERCSEEILYESLIYYKTSFKNVRELFKRDNIYIKYFQGCNGKLSFREIKVG